VRLWLYRVDQIRKLHRVLNKKDGDIVTDEVIVAFARVKFNRKSAHVARQVS
jgi:hypothetical protein